MPQPQILVDAERLCQEQKFKEAAALYDRILAQNERNPFIVNGLARVLMQDNDTLGASIALHHLAIDLFKNSKEGKVPFEVYSNLGIAYKWSGQHDKALKWAEKAVSVAENAKTLCNYGQLFNETDTDQRGRKALEKAVKLDPSHTLAHWNLSLNLLATARRDDNWERAWAEYEYGKVEGGRVAKKVPLPDWDGESGQKILVHGEQGIGDEIMFASMLPDLMQRKEVILDCHSRLTTLFERSFGVRCYGTRKNPELDWIEAEKPDAYIAIGSLGRFFRKKNVDFSGTPYLKADPLPRGEKFRVGISWTGGRISSRVAKRTVPLNWWRSILDCPEVEFVSLQYTDGSQAEIDSVNAQGYSISEPEEAKATDYYQTARLVASCDLVITVCTSLVHLAGALGVPTWVMVPKQPAWRYQASGPQPWYRSVRLYRQLDGGANGWMPVVQTIGADLTDLIDQRRRKAA